jgi:hypothetical protein
MPSNRQQAYIEIGISAVPVATTAISLAIEAEAVPAFFAIAAGVGAGLSLAAAPVLIAAAIAVAVVDDKTVSEIRTSVGQLGKVTSPGFVFSVPFGAAVTPQDPTLFASAVGPGLDLLAGALSPSGFDQFQTAQQSFIGFGTWFSDMQKFAASGSSVKPSTSAAPSGASRESSGYSSADLSSSDSPASGDWNSGGFPYDSAAPGGNETRDVEGPSSAPDQSWELDLQESVPIGGIETGLGSEPSEGESSQNDSAEAGPYSDQESQAAEDAAAAAEQGSESSNDGDDRDNDDDDRDDD